jgi:hypothetical protein
MRIRVEVRGSPERPRTRGALYSADKAIAAFREGLNEPRPGRRISEHVTQLADGLVDRAVEIDERSIGPQPLAKLLSCDHEARMLDQREQQTERLLTQSKP